LKVLSTESANQPNRLERFRREAKQCARLRHENIVTLYEFGEADSVLYMAMELVDGIDVEELLRLHGPLDAEDARTIIAQIASALDHAHRMGVVHRDVKPSNILITMQHGRCIAKLVDLGLARGGIEETSRITSDGSTVGTVDYMSPEQARDSASADTRSDIYSLGCTIYQMLSGSPPFAEGAIVERLLKHVKTKPADLRLLQVDVPDDLWAICKKMLEKQPAERYQTPAELLIDLANAAPHAGSAASGSPTKMDGRPTKLSVKPQARNASPSSPAVPLVARFHAQTPAGARPTVGEGKRIASGQFEHATHAVATGNFDYGIMLLLNCCRLEPGNIAYHQALRNAQFARRAAPGARPWRSLPIRWLLQLGLKLAVQMRQPLRVLTLARQLLTCDPEDLATQLEMARAARDAGFFDLALWLLETAQAANPEHDAATRALAELLEDRGEFGRALALWEGVVRENPNDGAAGKKVRDLAARVATGKVYAARKAKRAGGRA
jgi:tRNA A-37 threonylcarbamoyl transferase component Bud32/tetratricopeptide (TPR) repeat protein